MAGFTRCPEFPQIPYSNCSGEEIVGEVAKDGPHKDYRPFSPSLVRK